MARFSIFGRRSPAPTTAVTAAAAAPVSLATQFLRHPARWQNEVWDFYDDLGEFNYGVWWLSNMLSRVRLRAAKLQPDVDEPEIVTEGPAADLMMLFGGGTSGQAQIMKRLTTQLSVPGEGYLVGEVIDGAEQWMIRSVDEIRAQSGTYMVMNEKSVIEGQEWRPVAENSFVHRVWRPHDRYYHLADSPARSARPIMRELELVNRKIIADYLSRIASAGMLLFPNELDFPIREEFRDDANGFVREWVALASEAIDKPGTASAVVPMPVTGEADALKEVRFVDFSVTADEQIIEKRDSAIKRLATKLDLPAEVLLGMGDVNHWGAWQLEEGALKTHIAPVAELICDSLTHGYLQPRLKASGEKDIAQWVVWYDMSELALRPDRSKNAGEAYDRLELSGMAYRRELGFDEDDAPKNEDLLQQALRILLRTNANLAGMALEQLTGKAPPVTGAPPAPALARPPGQPEPVHGPPEAPPDQEAARAARLIQQARTQHMVRFTAASGSWQLLHPGLCHEYEYSCPFTHAVSRAPALQRPGGSGVYLCRLDSFGRLVIDGEAPYADTRSMITTLLHPAVNGHG